LLSRGRGKHGQIIRPDDKSPGKRGRFQFIDVVNLMHPITKYSGQVVDGNNIPSMVLDAFRIAS